MQQVNRYYRRSRIAEKKFRQIVRYFAMDLTAAKTSELTGITRKSVNVIFQKIRIRLLAECERHAPFQTGVVELDESYFGRRRIPGKRGRGASGKTIVFGIYKRGDKVYTEIVPNCQRRTLQAIIRGKIGLDAVIHTDGWVGYDGLVDLGFKKHFRVNHHVNEFANKTGHINGIESFWSFAKRRMLKFNGLRNDKFLLHLKECEFRFNHRNHDLYKTLLSMLRTRPL